MFKIGQPFRVSYGALLAAPALLFAAGQSVASVRVIENFSNTPTVTVYHGSADGFAAKVGKPPAGAAAHALEIRWKPTHKSYAQMYFSAAVGLPHTLNHPRGKLEMKIYATTPNCLWAVAARIKDNNGEIFSFQIPMSIKPGHWKTIVIPVKYGLQQARWGPGATAPMQGPINLTGLALGLNPHMPAGFLWIKDVAWQSAVKSSTPPSGGGVVPQAPVKKMPLIASVFTSNMVLQREHRDPVWGWAPPHQEVTVSFAGQTKKTIADAAGKWMVKLNPMQANATGAAMDVVAGSRHLVLSNILVGDVWLCAGQSNMEYPMYGWTPGADTAKFIKNADHPTLRLLTIPNQLAATARRNLSAAAWQVCTPQTVRSFSAVAYFFGNDLRKKLGVPIGLIADDWGGTPIQPWMPRLAYQGPQFQWDMNQINTADRAFKKSQKLYDNWVRRAEKAQAAGMPLPPRPARPKNVLVSNPEHQMVIFNAMVNPLIPYRLRGIVWYQGESNCYPDAPLYFIRLRALIDSWRKLWHQGNIPFGIVQIAPYAGYGNNLYEPDVWRGEEKVAATVPDTGIVGTMDVGLLNNIHPFNKQAVGHRLALWALARVYGRKGINFSGPIFKSINIAGSSAIIHFHYTDGGLATRNGKALNDFEIAGPNHKYMPARARIVDNSIVVHTHSILHPVAVRFAWSDRAQPNLMNKAGLPALPFSAH